MDVWNELFLKVWKMARSHEVTWVCTTEFQFVVASQWWQFWIAFRHIRTLKKLPSWWTRKESRQQQSKPARILSHMSSMSCTWTLFQLNMLCKRMDVIRCATAARCLVTRYRPTGNSKTQLMGLLDSVSWLYQLVLSSKYSLPVFPNNQ